MPKPKQFLKESRSKKTKLEPILDTADDYQAAGVEFEEAAGKHRAGDVAKSLRFFSKAISTYDDGLSKFPESFDLAYNKARVQYEVATHPKLIKHLQVSIRDALREALSSHEYALRLREDDADLLFNTAQVLTSLAEELANSEEAVEARRLLQLALELQSRCLGIQEVKYAEMLQQQKEAQEFFVQNSNGDSAMSDTFVPQNESKTSSASGEEQWASVLEPVTVETLVDTILACFATMTTLCTTIASSEATLSTDQNQALATLETQATLLTQKFNTLQPVNPETRREVTRADTILKSALLDAAFTFATLPAIAYKESFDSLWSTATLDLSADPETQIAHAEALNTLASSLSQSPTPSLLPLIWTALSTAHTSLTRASKSSSLPDAEKSKTQSLLAATSLQQYRLSHPPSAHPPAVANATTLLRNAEVYYRNAATLSAEPGEKERAAFRSDIVKQLREQGQVVLVDTGGGNGNEEQKRMREGLEEMVEEELLIEKERETGAGERMFY